MPIDCRPTPIGARSTLIATVSVSRNPRADYWVKVSTLRKGKPVSVPLQGYDHFRHAPGRVRNFCEVSVSVAGEVFFALVKESVPSQRRDEGVSVGLDWGLKSVFTTSDGELLGRRLYGWLCLRDRELSDLVAALQRQGIRPRDSQRCCSGCGYVDKKNRTSQKRFVCRFCGKALQADINAARNVLGRSEAENGLRDLAKGRVLAELDRSFRARWRIEPTLLRERSTRGRSTATSSPTTSTGVAGQPRVSGYCRHAMAIGWT
ncbi:zinc ribbon domain-containing protein [Nocardia sp. CA-145437]|uniref:zinc ribbon domain-containing protein n=1 Tax=Nocardia sp. CA-145437 TaxID=3239980 RepID=UPI003D97AA86